MPEPDIPQVFEQETRTPVVIKPEADPVLGPVMTELGEPDTTLPDAAREDIRMQQEGVSFKDVLEGKVSRIGSLNVTPKLIEAAKEKPALMQQLKIQHTMSGQQVAPEDVQIPFMREGEFIPPAGLEKSPMLMSTAERLAVGRKEVDDILFANNIKDPVVRQIFVDEFTTGSFYESTMQRLGEAGQFVATAPPAAYLYGTAAMGATYDSFAKGTDWSAEWGARQNELTRSMKSVYDTIDKVIDDPTMAMAFQTSLEEELQVRLDDGRITQDDFDRIMFAKDAEGNFILDNEGNKVKQQIITDTVASDLMNVAFNQLPTSQKFGVIFIETAAGMGGPGSIKGAAALNKYNRLVKSIDPASDYGKAIAGKTDPFEVVNILEGMGKKTKINRAALSIGVHQQRTSMAVEKLSDQIDSAGRTLDSLRIRGIPKNSTEYRVALGNYNNLTSRMLKTKYTLQVYPYFKEATEEALVISAGQLAAREMLPQYFDVSPETAEVIGVIGMIAGGSKVTRKVGGQVHKSIVAPRYGAAATVGRTFEFFGMLTSVGALRKGTGFALTDRTFQTFEIATGKKLSADDIRGIRASMKMINNLDPQERERVLNAIDDYVELRDRIVMAFPEDQRAEADRLFNQSFSNASGLSFLSGVTAVTSNQIKIRDLNGKELNSVIQSMEAATFQVEITERALANLENLSLKVDMADKEAVTNFITSNRNALISYKNSQRGLAEQQLNLIDDIRKHVLSDPTIELPEDFLVTLSRADTSLREQLGMVVDQRKNVGEMLTDYYSGLTKRLTLMKGRRSTPQYTQELANSMELVIDTHLDSVWMKGDAAYAKVREMSQGRENIDMTEAVEFMMDAAGETNYERFFSPEGQFFSGKLGRQNLAVFDDMVKRSIPNIDELRELLVANGAKQDYVSGLSNIELAMELKRISPEFKPFSQLNAYEVDVLRRTFRDYGYKVRDGQPGLSKVYGDYEVTINRLIREQDPDIYGVLQEARTIYRSEVGDRLRPGSFLLKVDSSRQGGEIVTFEAGQDMYRYAYKNVNPLSVFDPISDNITKSLKGDYKASRSLQSEVTAILTQFGDTVDKKRMFDLTTPEGKAKFEALQAAVGEKVFQDWIQREVKVFERVRNTDALRGGGYVMDNLSNEAELNQLLQVPVRLEDGTMANIPLVNLGDIYSDHRSLSKLMRENEEIRNKYDEFISEYNNLESKTRRNITNKIAAQDSAFETLKSFTGGIDADAFYKRYILDAQSPQELEILRDMFVNSQVKTKGMKAKEAANLFDAAVGQSIARGFVNRGGLQPIPGDTLRGLKLEVGVTRQFTTPENMLSDIRDHREQLEAVLGNDHVSYLEDIATFLNRARDESTPITGMVRGYSLNEGLSRTYNVSRGMVSPLYVSSEFAVRLAARANIDVLGLAAGNKDAARIISTMMSTPELVTSADIKFLDAALREFAFTEMARADFLAPQANELFLLPDEEETTNENE